MTTKPQSFTLYDSYLKKEVDINPNKTVVPNTVKLYSCGPTVYNYQSIGNMRAVWLPDTITKMAKIAGWKVEWVLNITDVGHLVSDGDEGEDKIEKGAKRDGKTVAEIVDYYTEDYKKQCEALNFELPQNEMNPKATEYVEEQMLIALELLKMNRAYILEDGIYYDTEANRDLEIEQLENKNTKNKGNSDFTGRKIVSNNKRSEEDFALWKFVGESTIQKWKFQDFEKPKKVLEEVVNKESEKFLLSWGTPGWHSECVGMICGILGKYRLQNKDSFDFQDFKEPKNKPVIDIHTGGEDHIDIHHKNEILQSESLGFHLSKYWVHNKFVMVDGGKMSKSLGNVYLVTGQKSKTGFDSIEEKGFNPLAYRLMLMEHHYTEQMNFTWEKLEASANRLNNLKKLTALVSSFAREQKIKPENEVSEKQKNILLSYLLDNLNTPKFLEKYQNFLEDIVNEIQQKQTLNSKNLTALKFWENEFLNLDLFPKIENEILELAEKRLEAKTNKDYPTADKYRSLILEKNWQVDDYKWGFGLWKI